MFRLQSMAEICLSVEDALIPWMFFEELGDRIGVE